MYEKYTVNRKESDESKKESKSILQKTKNVSFSAGRAAATLKEMRA